MAIVESTLRKKLEAMLGSRVELVETTRVNGHTGPPREVLVFAILDHPNVAYCYAREVDGRVDLSQSLRADTTAAKPIDVPRAIAPLTRPMLDTGGQGPCPRSADELYRLPR